MAFSGFMGYMSFQIESWERVMFILVCIFSLAYGLWLVINYARNNNLGNLEVGEDYLKVPIQGKNPYVIMLNEIKEIGIVDYPEHSIIFKSEKGSHVLKKNWMAKKDFHELVEKLKDHALKDKTFRVNT